MSNKTTNSNKTEKQKKPLNKAIALSGAGLQMGVTIYLGFLLGEWLDFYFKTTYLTQTVTLVAVFIAIFTLIKQAKRIND